MLCRHTGKLLVATGAIFFILMGGSAQQKIGLEHEPAHPTADPVILGGAIIIQMGLISPLLTVLALVLTTTGQTGLSKRLADTLSNQLLARVAELSYDIYLVHPLVSVIPSTGMHAILQLSSVNASFQPTKGLLHQLPNDSYLATFFIAMIKQEVVPPQMVRL